MSASSELAAQRLAEAPLIVQEWNAMSYKDRAAWWMSAKWYGYMSTEAYRRGDISTNTNESCRYGEPGFFIATRVPYYEAQEASATVVSPPPISSNATTEASTHPTKPDEPVDEPSPSPSTAPEPANVTAPAAEAPISEPVLSETQTVRDAIVSSINAANTPILATATATNPASTAQKKKKKNKNHGGGEGKTIQIRVGVTGKQ